MPIVDISCSASSGDPSSRSAAVAMPLPPLPPWPAVPPVEPLLRGPCSAATSRAGRSRGSSRHPSRWHAHKMYADLWAARHRSAAYCRECTRRSRCVPCSRVVYSCCQCSLCGCHAVPAKNAAATLSRPQAVWLTTSAMAVASSCCDMDKRHAAQNTTRQQQRPKARSPITWCQSGPYRTTARSGPRPHCRGAVGPLALPAAAARLHCLRK